MCLRIPFSNATFEGFFSNLNVVKTEIRLRLSSESLISVMRTCMKWLSITEFKEKCSIDSVDYW